MFAFEKPAASIEQAERECKTGFFWYIYGGNDYTDFDFSFIPPPWQSNFMHVWGDQYHEDGNVCLTKSSQCERLYHSERVHRLPDMTCWSIPSDVDPASVNTRWCPDPLSPPYIYVFANQWNLAVHETTATYTVPGATEFKYIEDMQVRVLPTAEHWTTHYQCEWDYSWRPNPKDPPYIYVFGNQWYPAEVMPTVTYTVPGATEKKFVNSLQAKLPERHDNHWHTLVDCEWDYSWVPDPGDPPYIYVFGNQWYPAEKMATVEYHVPGAIERKFMTHPRAKLLPTTENWVTNSDVEFDFDYSWAPDPGDPPYIYVFGNQHWSGERSSTVEYHVPGATEKKFIHDIKAELDNLDIFFIDMGNPTAQARFDTLCETQAATKVRYVNSIYDTIKRCATRAKTPRFWVVSSEYSLKGFDFTWQPEPWQHSMTHVFPSQHNKWSNTFLISKWEFERHSKWAEGLEQFPNLNFVTNQQVTKVDNLYTLYYIDHGNPESKNQYDTLKLAFPDIVSTRFANTYLDTFKRIMFNAETEYVWILNSICDYKQFDFTWQPEPWQKEMIHCFVNSVAYNNSELRGDTFYIHAESFKKQMVELELLDWFNVINYVVTQKVERYPVPAVHYRGDSLVDVIKAHNFTTPYVLFTKSDRFNGITNDTTCLWTEKDRVVKDYSADRSTTMVPRDIKKYLKTQIYDYPYLSKSEDRGATNVYTCKPLDIVYISNGEPDAERWYEHLVDTVYGGHPLHPVKPSRIKRVQNVNGRVAAYQAAADASTTEWFFAVFAKLEVDLNFDWLWQPDYWQEPKHYIFNARNPINGLEYGHMGMIAYNKRLVLENNNPGIDFTLSQAHESVPILSGTAHFNQDAWTTWRTAFREALKLRMFMDTQPTLETEHRLDAWLNKANSDYKYSYYSLVGARDAVEFYEKVKGDPAQLQQSFEWAFLRDLYDKKYK